LEEVLTEEEKAELRERVEEESGAERSEAEESDDEADTESVSEASQKSFGLVVANIVACYYSFGQAV
jgi:hypothetical protein